MIARIAIISEHASPLASLGGVDSGGQNVYVAQLANYLAARGYKVDVFTRRDDASLPEIVKFINRVRVVHVSAGPAAPVPKERLLPFMPEFARNVLAFCQRQHCSYDIVHANFWTSGVVAMTLQRERRIPFVVTFHALGRVRRRHQGAADRFPDERPQVEERIVAAADGIIAECPQDRADLIQLYRADAAKIRVIPCGFDPTEFWPVDKVQARRELIYRPDERLILQLGRMVPRKGIDVPIRALARLNALHGMRARLVIVGGESDDPDPVATPEIARLRSIADAAGVADQVEFTGRRGRPVLRYYYSAADIFVTTPWYEPFGITPVEAMACATPVIGTRVGGIRTTVQDGKTGFLVPPHDADAVADRIAYLYAHPEVLRAFAQAARARAIKQYTWAQIVDRVAAMYDDVATSTRKRAALDDLRNSNVTA